VTALKRIMAVLVLVMVIFAVSGATAFAAPPGPGSRQCSPGQSGNPNDPPKHPPSCPGA
jgi:hypothetical protein